MSEFFPLTEGEAKERNIVFTSLLNKNAIFPTRLRELREALNAERKSKGMAEFTQSDLAEVVGATRATIGTYENGDSVPDIKRFTKIAEFYGVSYDYLLREDGAQRKENVSIHDEIGLSDDTIELVRGLRKLKMASKEKDKRYCFFDLLDKLIYQAYDEIYLCSYQNYTSADTKITGESYSKKADLRTKLIDRLTDISALEKRGALVIDPDEMVAFRAQTLADKVKQIICNEYNRIYEKKRFELEGGTANVPSSEDQ